MDSDEDSYDNDNVDSGNVSSGDDDFAMEVDINNTKDRQQETEEYPFEVLSTEQILQHMVDCIKDVNTVVEVSFFFICYWNVSHDGRWSEFIFYKRSFTLCEIVYLNQSLRHFLMFFFQNLFL